MHSLFNGGGIPKVESFAMNLAVTIGDKRSGRHEASSDDLCEVSFFLLWTEPCLKCSKPFSGGCPVCAAM